jgi:hypothetical protein
LEQESMRPVIRHAPVNGHVVVDQGRFVEGVLAGTIVRST